MGIFFYSFLLMKQLGKGPTWKFNNSYFRHRFDQKSVGQYWSTFWWHWPNLNDISWWAVKNWKRRTCRKQTKYTWKHAQWENKKWYFPRLIFLLYASYQPTLIFIRTKCSPCSGAKTKTNPAMCKTKGLVVKKSK